MADPAEWAILDRVATLLAGITTGGGYNIDLSGSGQVYVGDAEIPPSVLPVAAISWVSDEAVDGLELGRYRVTTRFEVLLMVEYATDTAAGRMRAVMGAVYDVRRVLEGDRTLNGYVWDLLIERVDDVSGVTMGQVGPSVAGAVLAVRVYRERTAGAA